MGLRPQSQPTARTTSNENPWLVERRDRQGGVGYVSVVRSNFKAASAGPAKLAEI